MWSHSGFRNSGLRNSGLRGYSAESRIDHSGLRNSGPRGYTLYRGLFWGRGKPVLGGLSMDAILLTWLYLFGSIFVGESSGNWFCWTLAGFSSHNSFPLWIYHRFRWLILELWKLCFRAATSFFCFSRCSSFIFGVMTTAVWWWLQVFGVLRKAAVLVKVTFPSDAVPMRAVRYSSSVRQKLIELESRRRSRSKVSAVAEHSQVIGNLK